jgi:hypothetical protein
MSRRDYWVSFRAEADEPADTHPAGEAVRNALRNLLQEQGLDCGPVDNWRDSGFSVDCCVNDRTVHVFVSRIKAPDSWIACCTSNESPLKTLFGKRDPERQLETLVQAVSHALNEDGRFTEVRWYPGGWKGKGTEQWSNDPFQDP